MKRLLLITALITGSFLYSQEYTENYNKWSIEASAGLPLADGSFAKNYHYKNNVLGAYTFGVRKMFNNRVGLKLNFGYHTLENTSYSESYAPFESNFATATLEGVANLSSVLNFDSWTKTIGVLAHVGAGYSVLWGKEPVKVDKFSNADQMMHFSGGITPQVRLGNRVALHADFTIMKTMRMHHTWDWIETTDNRGINATFGRATAGLTVYLGKHDVHGDWVYNAKTDENELSDLEARVAKIEADLLDSDGDGVPDYLDEEPNTPAGMMVDSKGRSIDKNNNNIPDYMESALDSRYAVKGEGGEGMVIKQLIDSGLINVYFPFDSTKPHSYSTHAINYVIQFLNDNPNVNVELVGYADEIGNSSYNQTLSERRAKLVHDILLASGISSNRLSYRGAGEDDSVDKDNSYARQLMRRVIFVLD